MLELNDVALETVAGGHFALPAVKNIITNTNNSTVLLSKFSVKGSGGLAVVVTQSIG